jgi:hypothetical protein
MLDAFLRCNFFVIPDLPWQTRCSLSKRSVKTEERLSVSSLGFLSFFLSFPLSLSLSCFVFFGFFVVSF